MRRHARSSWFAKRNTDSVNRSSSCEPANWFYLIETGKVILESSEGLGDPAVIDTIGAGDLLGWLWMLLPYSWHFTARAVEATKAIFFYGTILREYCEKDHSLGHELLKRMTVVMNRRMQAARNKSWPFTIAATLLSRLRICRRLVEQELDASTL